MKTLSGRTAVVTGAASGIGYATARSLGREGMRLVLADVEAEPLAKTADEFSAEGFEVLAVRTDVSRWEDVEELARRSIERFGAVHVLHNNAGVVVGGPIRRLTLADWQWVLGVDLWGVIHGVKAFLPLLEQADEAHIVNTASTAGFYAQPFIAPYNVAKFGVVALSETLHRELEASGSPVGVSVLCPGAIDTRIVESQRNRPAESARDHEVTPQEKSFLSNAGAMLAESGLDPADVASLVVDAIRDDRFWIVTHPAWLDVLRDRVEGMADGGRLTSGSGG